MRKRRLHMSSMTTNRDRSDVCLSILITFREKFNLYLAGINGAWESNENTTIARRSTQRNSWDRPNCCVHSIGFFFSIAACKCKANESHAAMTHRHIRWQPSKMWMVNIKHKSYWRGFAATKWKILKNDMSREWNGIYTTIKLVQRNRNRTPHGRGPWVDDLRMLTWLE